PTLPHDDGTVLNRTPRSRTFPARNASSPIQLSPVPASLRKPDHALPNEAALCLSREERVQLSFSCSRPCVLNNVTRAEAIQLDPGISDAPGIAFRTRLAPDMR